MAAPGKIFRQSRPLERSETMIPLSFADHGEMQIIKKIGGSPEVKKHLEDLGLVAGGEVSVISANDGNVILKVKDSRLALSSELAAKIMV